MVQGSEPRLVGYPRQLKFLKDPMRAIRLGIIGGYAPPAPFIPPTATVACIGSCFAQEMSKSLAAQGKQVAPIWLSERWNTAFAVRHFVERALDGTPFPEGYVGGADLNGGDDFKGQLGASDAFLVTFGLSACWYETATNRMVLDINQGHSAAGLTAALSTHAMRQTSVAENVAQIRAVITGIRRHKPAAPIILTLSPIPLMLSATDYPVVASNAISKGTLRAALHEVMETKNTGVHYWPSYEIVEWLTRHHGPVWGQDGEDLRHLSPHVVEIIMTLFSEYYFQPAA